MTQLFEVLSDTQYMTTNVLQLDKEVKDNGKHDMNTQLLKPG